MMKQMSIPVKPENQINIKVSGDLNIEGGDQPVLTAVVRHSEAFRLSESSGRIDLKASTDCSLKIPAGMALTIERVSGDVTLTGLRSRVIIGKVSGDLYLDDLDGASVESVGGDLYMKNISGAVEFANVGGAGYGDGLPSLSAGNAGGDAFLQKVSGNLKLNAGGDLNLVISGEKPEPLSVRAGGDIRLTVPAAISAQLEISSGGETIEVHVGDQQGSWDEPELNLPLGDGGNLLKLRAGGDVTVTDQATPVQDFTPAFDRAFDEWNDFGVDLERQIRDSLNLAGENLHWGAQKAGEASEKARMKMEKAMRKLESKGINLDSSKLFGFSYDNPPPVREVKPSKVSDEERMMVLQMLQDKKISVEEADKLLSALEK